MPQTKSQRAMSAKSEKDGDKNSENSGGQSDSDGLAAIHATLKGMDSKFSKRLDSIEKRFTDVMTEVKSEFGKLRDELKEENAELKSRLDGLESSLEFHVESLEELEKAQNQALKEAEQKLRRRVNSLEESLLIHEKNSRKYNLLLYGIPPPPPTPVLSQEGEQQTVKQPRENIYQTIKSFLKTDCKMDDARVDAIRYQHAHRLPKRRGANISAPEAIIVRFVSYADREEVFQRGFNLPKGKRILSDLPVQMKEERYRLASVAYEIRQKEKLQTRIREAGLNIILETRKNKEDKWVVRLA